MSKKNNTYRKFQIYHAILGKNDKPVTRSRRRIVGAVMAHTVKEAFRKATPSDPEWRARHLRATTINDVIYDVDKRRTWIVIDGGFVEVHGDMVINDNREIVKQQS